MPAYKDEKKGTWFVRIRYKEKNGKWKATHFFNTKAIR